MTDTNAYYIESFGLERKVLKKLPDGAVDIYHKMTQNDPEKRWTADMLLKHPWFDNIRAMLEPKFGESNSTSIAHDTDM